MTTDPALNPDRDLTAEPQDPDYAGQDESAARAAEGGEEDHAEEEDGDEDQTGDLQ